jgi:hypothetical protein
MSDVALAPDRLAVEADLKSVRFRLGSEAGRWRLIELAWPHALIAVSAAPREGAPGEFVLRLELSGFPQSAPTACVWDRETGAVLAAEFRPKGPRANQVFSSLSEGQALYAPWDRVAIEGHAPEWAGRWPRLMWHPERDLAFFLKNVHDVLNGDDYVGI